MICPRNRDNDTRFLPFQKKFYYASLFYYIPAIRQSQIYVSNIGAKLSFFCNHFLVGVSLLRRIRRFRQNAGWTQPFRRSLWKFFPLTFSRQSAKLKSRNESKGAFPLGKRPCFYLQYKAVCRAHGQSEAFDMKGSLPLSQRAQAYPASGIRKMAALAAQYQDTINLTLGEPDFDTPVYIREAAKRALDEGYTHYSPNAGMPGLRDAVARRCQAFWPGYTRDHVIITAGALEGMTLTFMALLDPGDEVLVPDPCFSNYYGQAILVGARAVPVPTYEENGFRIQASDIEKAITPKTRGIVLNSPANPTGAVLSREDILSIAQVVQRHDLWVFSDEPYDALVFDGVEHFSMAQVPEVRDRVILLNSFSKTYAMTGWRVGYAVMSDPAYIAKLAQLQEGVVSCIPTFVQVAAAEAFRQKRSVDAMVREYARRRDILVDGLNRIPGFRCGRTAGGFYAFPNIKAFGKSSQAFAEELLEHARVVVIPGSVLGAMGEGYLRIVFASSEENLREALRRMDRYVRFAYPQLTAAF